MKILIVSATPFEIAPLENYLKAGFECHEENCFKKEDFEIELLVTGVGIPFTVYALTKKLGLSQFNLVINVGIAGAFNRGLEIGDVVNVIAERFGDLGVEEQNGQLTDVMEMGLIDENNAPFLHGELIHPVATEITFLPKVKGLTVNKVHGKKESIEAIQQKYDADIESMEGAAFFMVCLLEKVHFFEIRSISNFVEPRNRDNWNLPLAIENLNITIIEIIESFHPSASKPGLA